MRKPLHLLFTLFLFLVNAGLIRAQDLKHCGTTEMLQKLYGDHPELIQLQNQYDEEIREAASSDTRDDQTIYIIPIVFHVIHNYGSECISDEQVKDAVKVLNEDYRKLNPDTAEIVNAFLGIAGDAKIEFRLAQKTPGGGCTNGIDHIVSHETYQGNDGSKLSQWPRNMYLNVWTVNTMADGVAGYAYYPSAVQGFGTPFDGIMILSDYIGSIGTSSPFTSRALSHEIGHYLNLPHTWGSNNSPGVACGDDGVFDTPETKGWTTCNLSGAVCNPGVIENVQNYMEYAYCSNMFTNGQVEIMRGVLENTVSDRNNLWTESNLAATGTNEGFVSECAPRADFNPNHYNICQGSDILFTDFSWGADVTQWSWQFPGGTPATSDVENPLVIFNDPGKHTVTLTVSNSIGSSTISKDIYVTAPVAQINNYLHEEFEDQAEFTNNWIVRNVDDNTSEWSLSSNAASTGSHSLVLDNFYGDGGDIDYFISPSVNLSGLPQAYLSFDFASASSSGISDMINDIFKVYSSTNCGEQWIIRYTGQGLSIINNGAWGTPFTPGAASNWTTISALLPSAVLEPNVLFKFEFTGGDAGNNFFIDNVTVSQYPTGIGSASAEWTNLNIFPNPTNGDFHVTYSLTSSEKVRLTVLDVSGRELVELINEDQQAGTHQHAIQASELNGLSNGVYVVRMEANGKSVIRKLVIDQQ